MSKLEEAEHKLKDTLQRVRGQLEPADRWVRDMARQHPFATLLSALGVGYIVGRLFRRTVGA
jgi:hypothetical protein